jgi:hypothetical protein
MEEALKRAKVIVESEKANGKTLNQLMGEAVDQKKRAGHIEKDSESARKELSEEASSEERSAAHNIKSASQDKAHAKSTKEQLDYDVKVHKLEKGDLSESSKEVKEIDCAVEDADFIVKEAEKVQKSEKKKK